jgi:hypothetical protein
MSWLPKGKHVCAIDVDHPNALGICDSTGFVFFRKDMVRQMEWRGDRLAWTGFYVGRPYLDKPNAQLKPPHLKPDPVPVKDPRLPQGTNETWPTISFPVWPQILYTLWPAWGSFSDGVPVNTPDQRLAALEAGGNIITTPVNAGGYPPLTPALPEDSRLTLLETFRWVS